MNNQESLISIDKDEYFKTFFAKRKALHMNLIQQLIAKSESKKELVMQQASQIIDRFIEYRDDFITNLPPSVKTMKVKDYMTKYDSNFHKCLKSTSMEDKSSNSILNEKFDIEPEIQAPPQKFHVEEMVTVPKFVVEGEKSNTIPHTNRTGFESLKSFDDKENEMFLTVNTDFSKENSKMKDDQNVPQSNRKRKKPQIENPLKENKNLINLNPEHHKPSFNPSRILNLIKEAKALQSEKPSINSFTPTQNKILSKFISPAPAPGSSRKPVWMP